MSNKIKRTTKAKYQSRLDHLKITMNRLIIEIESCKIESVRDKLEERLISTKQEISKIKKQTRLSKKERRKLRSARNILKSKGKDNNLEKYKSPKKQKSIQQKLDDQHARMKKEILASGGKLNREPKQEKKKPSSIRVTLEIKNVSKVTIDLLKDSGCEQRNGKWFAPNHDVRGQIQPMVTELTSQYKSRIDGSCRNISNANKRQVVHKKGKTGTTTQRK